MWISGKELIKLHYHQTKSYTVTQQWKAHNTDTQKTFVRFWEK